MRRLPSARAAGLAAGLAAAVTLAAAPARAANHVRVVLDLSQSMEAHDPGRLAILSTLLLFDLTRPNPTLDDSFVVIPFAPHWQWADADAPPPTDTGPPIAGRFDRRDDFVARLTALTYHAKKTYFYPGLLAAIGELERTPGGAYDARTIVLVTDGVPELPTRDAERRRIESELAPRLEKSSIRLYVLAFGGEADRNRDFFGRIVRAPGGSRVGDYFVDPQGRDLLAYMLQIFSGSFGFTADTAHRLPGTSRLDLDADTTPQRVAVVVLSPREQPPPQLRLSPPHGGALNAPEGVSSAAQRGGSYSLTWVYSPTRGDYRLDSDVASGSVALLRPTRLLLEILPAPPHRQTERSIASTPFPMRVRVRSPSGGLGDPGPVDLSFRTLGPRVAGAATTEHAWKTDLAAPPSGPGQRTPEGRVYDIVPAWREDPRDPTQTYSGYLEVEARRGSAVVGSLVGTGAHRVDVHPLLSIAPFPLSSYLARGGGSAALGRHDQACTRFALTLDAGRLPHPDTPRYSLRAVLQPRDPAAINRELRKAVVTLDGLPLDFAGHTSTPTAWSLGRPLDARQLLGDHELCLRVGKPAAADPVRPLEAAVVFTLQEDPYDDFGVVKPFSLKVRIAPPTFLEKWQLLLLAAFAAFAVAALLWYLRDRPAFPRDLGYALAREGSTVPLPVQEIPTSLSLRRLLGLAARQPVVAPDEDVTLGRVQASDADLYRFRPAPGVTVEPAAPAAPIAFGRGAAILSVHHTYRLRRAQGSYLFRLEYR